MADAAPTLKLPLFSANRVHPLRPLPGQEPTPSYAVVDIPAWAPEGHGLGYIVEQLGGRNVRVLAWIEGGSSVWPCSQPLTSVPTGQPLLRVCNGIGSTSEGVVELSRTHGPVAIASWEDCPHGDGRFISASLLPGGVGPYGNTDAALDLRTLTAASYLVFLELSRRKVIPDGPEESPDVLAPLLEEPLPDALDQIVEDGRPDNPEATPLQRYAARSLLEVGAPEVRRIVAEAGADVVRLSTTGLWWARFPTPLLSPEDRARLLSVEAVLNRVTLMTEQLSTGAIPPSLDQLGREVLTRFVADAPTLLDDFDKPNPLISYRGAQGKRGGQWDVRTRFARACERLRLPFRLEQRFDCDLPSGVAAVECATPPLSAFPGGPGDAPALAATYAVRLATTMAAAAFGSSVMLTNVVVTVFSEGLGGLPVLSVDFRRLPFNRVTLPALRSGSLAQEYEPEALVALLGQDARLFYVPGGGSDAGLRPIEPFRAPELLPHRTELWQDLRPLPEDLAQSLRATQACELDVYHDPMPELLEEVRSVDAEEADSPVVAVMRLEEVCDRGLKLLGERAEELEDKRPLYCSSGLTRLLVAEAPAGGTKACGVAAAEDPTQVTSRTTVAEGSTPRYYNLPDGFFEARLGLARRYLDLEDPARALATVEQCIALAPSSTQPRVAKAVMLGDLERFDEAAEELKTLLTMLIDREDTGFVYYRLAFALWQSGHPEVGAACYVLALAAPRFAEQSRAELAELLAENRMKAPSREEAEELLRRAHICIPQRDELLQSLAASAVGLVDGDFPMAAWQAVGYLADQTHSDDLNNVSASLRDGTPSAYV